MKKRGWMGVVALGLLGVGTTAQAVLIDAGNGLINDTAQNLVWTQDANLAASQTFGVSGINTNGTMSWDTAQAWIAAMNAANYKGYNDWRLWTVTDTGTSGCDFAYTGTDCGYNVDLATGELANLWYGTLGNIAYYDTSGSGPQAGWGLTNAGPFTHFQPSFYWSGTAYAPNANFAWDFDAGYGYQHPEDKNSFVSYAWAVRPGQVAAAPLPATLWLLGIGLAGLGYSRRSRGRRPW